MNFFFLRIIPLVLFFAGLWMTFSGIDTAVTAVLSRSWPSTAGVVTISKLEIDIGENVLTYGAQIEYEYAVNGETYTGNRVTWERIMSQNEAKARSEMDKYPVGAEVPVYYSRRNPANSILVPGVYFNAFSGLIFGVVFTVFASAFIFYFLPLMLAQEARKQLGDKNAKEPV